MSKNTCVIYAPIDTLSGYGARARDTVKSIIQLKKEDCSAFKSSQKSSQNTNSFR